MGYIGRGLNTGQYSKLDSIAGSFDGSVTTFSLEQNGTAVTPSAQNCLISLGGVIQEPFVAFSVTGSILNFTEAPATDDTFFGIVMGEAAFIAGNTVGQNELQAPSSIASYIGNEITGSLGANASLIRSLTAAAISGSFVAKADKSAISGSFISKADKSAISGSIVSGVSGSALSTGSFGRVEVAGDLSVTGTGQGWVKISQLNLTGDDANSATFTFADVFDTTYDVYMATLSNIHVDADGTALNMVYDIGGLQTGAYYGFHSQNVEGDGASYNASADKDGTNIELLADLGNAAGEVLSGIIYFYAPGDDNNMNTSSAHMFTMNTGSSPRGGTSHHNFTNSIAACTGFALDLTSGNFDDGTVTVYGLKN